MAAGARAAEPRAAFDDGWRFTRGDREGAESPAFDDVQWEPVDLPHDWAIAGPIAPDNPTGSPGGFFPAGVGWYRKTFTASEAWAGKHVTIIYRAQINAGTRIEGKSAVLPGTSVIGGVRLGPCCSSAFAPAMRRDQPR